MMVDALVTYEPMLAVEVTMATASISWRERDGGGWFGFKDDTGIARTVTERRIDRKSVV